jgi:hypothetical protein
MLLVISLCVPFYYHYAECHYAEYRYAEFRYVECSDALKMTESLSILKRMV